MDRPQHYFGRLGTDKLKQVHMDTGDFVLIPQSQLPQIDLLHSRITHTPEGLLLNISSKASNAIRFINSTVSVVPIKPIPRPRTWAGSVYYKGYVYVVGGVENCKVLDCYDLQSDLWKMLPDCPDDVMYVNPCPVSHADKLVVLGGYFGTEVNCYDIKGSRWMPTSQIKLPVFGLNIPVFTVNYSRDHVFYIVQSVLYAMNINTFTIRKVKQLEADAKSFGGTVVWRNSNLYCLDDRSEIQTFKVPLVWESVRECLWVLDSRETLKSVLRREVARYLV
mmetsp:Transcript_34715/g.61069  ORF Transcript_34715/g.61069 Transcript_34715/m.61069 type:complete len:278 (-) Transcript_34715:28-861(-)